MLKRNLLDRPDLVKKPIKPKDDLSGRPFGEWTVLEYVGSNNGRFFLCECSCGGKAILYGGDLRTGRTTSCGHDNEKYDNRRDGTKKHPLYNAWWAMLERCRNPAIAVYHYYGARGIYVCERWQRFKNFLKDMGERPSPDHQIERRDNDGPYSPENCCWATRSQQMRNTRRTIIVSYRGEKMCLQDLADRTGLDRQALRWRIKRGMGGDEAVANLGGSRRKDNQNA